MKHNHFHIIFLFSILFCFYYNLNAQAPNWIWAKNAGGISYDEGRGIVTDANGNVYMTGYFDSDSITFGTITLTNAGSEDIFIVKYDASGNVLWAKCAGGLYRDVACCIAIDTSGNIFITGSFSSATISFGTTTLTNVYVSNDDIFVVKYDANGTVLWATSSGGILDDVSISIATDASGNALITGVFVSPMITFGNTTLSNAGTGDIFVTKYDITGNAIWSKSQGGTSDEYGKSVATDASGNVFICGQFYSDTIIIGTNTLANVGSASFPDVFVVKYNSNGNVLWAKSAGGSVGDGGTSLAIDQNGNVIMTGFFQSLNINIGTTTLTNSGGHDVFIVKYDINGNVLWAKNAGGSSYDIGYSITNDSYGNIFLTGLFRSPTFIFGTTTLTNSNPGCDDIFLVKCNTNGNVIWAKSAGSIDFEKCFSVASDNSGNLFLTGVFQSPTISFGTTILTNAGVGDIFIAKLDTTMTTALPELQPLEAFNIAPNPFTTQTVITFSQEQTNSTIKIIDMLGKEIKAMNFTGKQFILQKENLQPGIYFLQAIDENNNSINAKFVIQ